MQIVKIYPPYIYSVQYDDEEENEFDRLFQSWNDAGQVVEFLEENRRFLKSEVWWKVTEPEDAARQVLDEAEALEELFDELNDNTERGKKPDYDSHFNYLGGKYKYELKWTPMKSYGTFHPSLLRIYAIKMASNTYLITDGGIKLSDTIQNSPDLKEHVLQNIDRVRDFLKEQGIIDNEDMENQ